MCEADVNSSLAQLLKTPSDQSMKKLTDHGGGLVNPAQVLGQISRKSEGLLFPTVEQTNIGKPLILPHFSILCSQI